MFRSSVLANQSVERFSSKASGFLLHVQARNEDRRIGIFVRTQDKAHHVIVALLAQSMFIGKQSARQSFGRLRHLLEEISPEQRKP